LKGVSKFLFNDFMLNYKFSEILFYEIKKNSSLSTNQSVSLPLKKTIGILQKVFRFQKRLQKQDSDSQSLENFGNVSNQNSGIGKIFKLRTIKFFELNWIPKSKAVGIHCVAKFF